MRPHFSLSTYPEVTDDAIDRLIAAKPVLPAVVEEDLDQIRLFDDHLLSKARAAIDKAAGGQRGEQTCDSDGTRFYSNQSGSRDGAEGKPGGPGRRPASIASNSNIHSLQEYL